MRNISLSKVVVTFAFIFSGLIISQPAWSGECDGNLQVVGPMGCPQALSHHYSDRITSLFSSGFLDPKKHSIRGVCDCTSQGQFVYCSASYEVHQCFLGASGTLWFSSESLISGGIFARWNTTSSNPSSSLMHIQSYVAQEAAESLVERVRNAQR